MIIQRMNVLRQYVKEQCAERTPECQCDMTMKGAQANYSHTVVVDCSNKGLHVLPPQLPDYTMELNVKGNRVNKAVKYNQMKKSCH